MSSSLRFRCTNCYSTGGAGDFSQAQKFSGPQTTGRTRLCKLCETASKSTHLSATTSSLVRPQTARSLQRRNLLSTNANPISHYSGASNNRAPTLTTGPPTGPAGGPVPVPVVPLKKQRTGQVHAIDTTKLEPVPLSGRLPSFGSSSKAEAASTPQSTTNAGANEEEFSRRLQSQLEAMERHHVVDSLGRIAAEYARTRSFPWALSNPFLKFFLPSSPGICSTFGALGSLSSLTLFASGLRHLGYSSFTDLLDMPSHYTMGFHGTPSLDNVVSIFQFGFDPTRRSGQAHGPGEYFDLSDDGSVAKGYARGDASGCLIVAMIVEKTKSGKPIVEFTKHNDDNTIGVLCNPKPFPKEQDDDKQQPSNRNTKGGDLPPLSYCIPCAVVSAEEERLEELEGLLRALVQSSASVADQQ